MNVILLVTLAIVALAAAALIAVGLRMRSDAAAKTGDQDVRRKRGATAAFAGAAGLFVLIGVVMLFAQGPTPEEQAAADAALAPQPAHPPGTTLHYTRSNQDGALAERVLVHVVSPTELAVAKMVAPCTDAALVTARFDPRTGEVTHLVGGRLQRDGTQLPQAFLTFDADARRLDVRMGDEASDPIESPDAPPAPWRMYDFDLAEFALYGPRTPDNFTFGVAMAWPDGSEPVLRVLGQAEAQLLDSGVRTYQSYNLFAVGGEAFGGADGEDGGLLTLDAVYGHVIEARFGAPNHPGYEDFLLRLDSITPAYDSATLDPADAPPADAPNAGEAAWREELLAHWRECPV